MDTFPIAGAGKRTPRAKHDAASARLAAQIMAGA